MLYRHNCWSHPKTEAQWHKLFFTVISVISTFDTSEPEIDQNNIHKISSVEVDLDDIQKHIRTNIWCTTFISRTSITAANDDLLCITAQ
jgi:hypothetical protein